MNFFKGKKQFFTLLGFRAKEGVAIKSRDGQ
jgi:hypothetical protein